MNYKITIAAIFFCFGFFFITSCVENEKQQNLHLWYQQPAQDWLQALPLGNGRMGAMVYGSVETERIELNELTLWSGQQDENQEIPCGKEKLSEIRKLFFEGKLPEGNQMASRYLSGQPHTFGTNLPAGSLLFNFKYENNEITAYERDLNLENAISTVSFRAGKTKYTREYFCSNPADLMMIKFTADKNAALNFDVKLDLLREAGIEVQNDEITYSGKVNFPKFGQGGVCFQGKVKVQLKGGTVKAGQNELRIENADEAVVLVDLRTDFKNPDYKDLCSRAVQKAAVGDYDVLKQEHITDYTHLFNRAELFLGKSQADKLPTDVRHQQLKDGKDDPGLFALFFQYGRYLLIASSRENSPLPAHLQGIWNDNLACNMPWTCDYHLDINTEQNYWLSNIGNLHECNKPLINYVKDLAVQGEKTAMKAYGSRGWTAHTVANVWGYTASGQGVNWGLFPTAGAWMASHLWDHFVYTGDEAFLRNEAYPVLKSSAVFFLDYMVENPHNGYLMTGPSTSPENSFRVDGGEYSLSMMPTSDRVLVYETLNSCIEASKILNIDPEFRQSLETAIAKLPPLKIGKNGGVQEWFEDYEEAHPNHRHTCHLLALYPYSQISLEKTPELASAADKTIQLRQAAEGWEDVEWSCANIICFYARLKNAEKACLNLKYLLTNFSRENLFTMAPGGVAGAESDIYEFDANEAGPAGIAEMLLQSHEGYIEFLPALPQDWKNGSFKGLCVRGGAEVDVDWQNGKVKKARLTATTAHSFTVKIPGNLKVKKNGVLLKELSDKELATVSLEKGEWIELF